MSEAVPTTCGPDFARSQTGTLHWLAAPTGIEVAGMYLILGIHIALATDALVPLSALSVLGNTLTIAAAALFVRVAIAGFLFAHARKRWKSWILPGLFIALLLVTHFTPWILAARVRLVESDLLREVSDMKVRSTAGKAIIHDWPVTFVGSTTLEATVRSVHEGGKVVFFRTVFGTGFLTERGDYMDGGIVYCETDDPTSHFSKADYTHLYGPWWRWRLPD